MKAFVASFAIVTAAMCATPASAQINAGVQVAGRVAGSCRALQAANLIVLRCSAPVVQTQAVKQAGQTKIITVAPAI